MSAMKGLLAGRGSDCESLVVALGLSVLDSGRRLEQKGTPILLRQNLDT